ncbi:hypothetical protein A2697_05475 [Candidatus Curtissbacteria bacterium RIFCSPHIGHO2_01_FULL_41_44]|uniref:2-oxoglutarate dehydrogenase n=1 Tax=Candidatus Curtissbacteria bacterium RIFCSPLOWO2_01_FULL_42_50 TaxID=1797730 RepID=A0A1F5H467_9BACT|nr:MAG: hypothetical protein A2697_05475 [Candidatus Curtissbacteria bacterium RIFCSPHIGHO2_01_FULL_41_44]OGD93256.1 MAG: hypothetical protein A3C33_04445 [Candidatus Curtissbacteria bacterium RIFCSPHIGHO2_02_FULL_42_58]OGD96896.1 MAG: hypothetical protein A3E71_00455 [Candidatus Curtissbacteria bacterium RIFCSPHIGHO2_12_FULL_42_33]OGD98960.1 MAG: hypothetical protein A3B54_01275 [Candidatus Curtissbacteria bacterium RIFCSPLOWO2_01_FULL_42_50]OGE03504.1 MAG: hypothetical protein A3G16_02835 [Ca
MKNIILLVKQYAIYVAFLQAWLATLGSLYFSEIRDFRPCLLCWYQRILMYPLIIILGVAIFRKDKNAAYYVLPMSIMGVAIAFYQYLLQMTSLADVTPISCSAYGPCREIQAVYLGFITIPFLSLIAFVLITLSMLILLKSKNK